MTNNNINLYLEAKLEKPKVMLFTEQKTIPFYLKAISHSFHDTMSVGMVQSSEEAIVKRFKITSFPSLIVVRRKNEKPLYYKGEMKFNTIYDFLNPYSEKFVFGDVRAKMKDDEQKVMKPWLIEELPELTKSSANDVCFHSGKLCVILIDKKEPDDKFKSLMKIFKNKYAQDNKFTYMWLNADLEKQFFKIFRIEDSELPKLVFLNAGSIKRSLVHSDDLTEAAIAKTYESIYGADARFTRLNMKNFPELTVRDTKQKADL